MPAPSIPTTFNVQQGDGKVALTWDQMATATSYQVQRSLDGITFSQIANISGSPLLPQYVDQNSINSSDSAINISSASVLIIGQPYVILSLGSTTAAQWQAIGVPAGMTPIVGLMFTASVTGSGTGTGTVKAGILTGQKYFYQVQATNGSGASGYTAASGIIPCLPGQECLGNIRLYAQQRADLVNSQFVTLTEWNQMITKAYKWLYDMLISAYGDDYYMATPYAFVTGTGQQYTLPDGSPNFISSLAASNAASNAAPAFYKLMLVEVALNPSDQNSWITIRKYQRIQQNLWNYPNVYTFRGITNLRYRLTGNTIMLVPSTQSGQTVRIWYAPRPSSLLLDTDTIDGIAGWEDFIILACAIKAMSKEESDTTDLKAEWQAMYDRLTQMAADRDIAEPETVSDSKMRNLAWTDDSGYGPGSGFFA